MRILNIEPKDIHVTIDFYITEIKQLLKALDKTRINYDGKNEPDMIEAAGFLKLFFKLLSEVEEEVGTAKRGTA